MINTSMRTAAAVLVVALAVSSPSARAEDAGLYAAPPPPDAAFVRVLNADVSNEANVSIGGVALVAPPAALSPYGILTRGDYSATIPGGTIAVSLVAQKFYTLLFAPGGTSRLVEDVPVTNPVHAGLYFYNLSGSPLELDAKVGGKQAAVFKAVAPGQATSREVNAFDVAFLVTNESGSPVELPPITMARQQGVSVVAVQSGDKITAFQVVNSVTATP